MTISPSTFRFLPTALSPSSRTRAFHSTSRVGSHVGSAPISYPASVTFEQATPLSGSPSLSTSSSSQLFVQGPKGRLAINVPPFVQLSFSDSSTSPTALSLAVQDSSIKEQRAAWGLTRSLVANAVEGVSEGYNLSLRLVGVGYRAAVEEISSSSGETRGGGGKVQRLNLKLGFAHPVLIELPSDVQASTPSSTTITLSGIDKQRLGEVAARIRRWRVPEPYNGKGIFVGDEQVKRKEVKKK
ncbi:mitochondrial 54S ribosomal protein uL6m MRPL6 [Sporobolomyces salmoneus]|uniref:mitochondrial 54S ribosomal protein uL6m MRPL6 n=1 Tax=Sporobolomyces salmoneus TaxID=183962 RepID=UPI00316E56D5